MSTIPAPMNNSDDHGIKDYRMAENFVEGEGKDHRGKKALELVVYIGH